MVLLMIPLALVPIVSHDQKTVSPDTWPKIMYVASHFDGVDLIKTMLPLPVVSPSYDARANGVMSHLISSILTEQMQWYH